MKFGVRERGLGGEKTQNSQERSRKMRSKIVLNEYRSSVSTARGVEL